MKIYWIKAQAPRRVLALAKHLSIPADFVHLDAKRGDLRSASYADINPNMKAPTLVDGDLVLWESSAIMAHLCIRQESDMWPVGNPSEQIEILRWLSWNDCHWAPAVGPFYFEHIVKATFNIGPPDRTSLETKCHDVQKFAKVLDRRLEGRTYVACDRLTIADFQLASMATDWSASEMPFTEFPHIVRWLEGLNRIDAWAHPWPDAASDARERPRSGIAGHA